MITKYFIFTSSIIFSLAVYLTHTITLSPANLPPVKISPIDVKAGTNLPSTPVKISIPAIKLDTQILSVTLNSENIVDVPASDVGWYQNGPRPGEIGNATLDGHFVDTNFNPGVFYNLSKLKIGDDIYTFDQNNQQFHFKVVQVATVKTDNFSVENFYGLTDKKRLNLVTCAGVYDKNKHNFSQRTLVYSELVDN